MLWWYRWKLTWNSSESRRDAAFNLGLSGNPTAIDPLLSALSDPVGEVRASAAGALGWLKAVPAMKPLCALLRDPEKEVRKASAEALGAMGGDHGIGPLCEAMGDPDPFVRKAVVEALKNSRDPRAIDAMARAAKDSERFVAEVAVEALGKIGDSNAVRVLLEVYALAQEREDKYRGTGIEFDKKVLGVLDLLASRNVSALIASLQHPHPGVRRFSAQFLGKAGDRLAIPALAATLRDPFSLVRWEAATALSLLAWEPGASERALWVFLRKEHNPDARPESVSDDIDAMIRALANLKDSGYGRGDAAGFLGWTRDARGLAPLLEALEDKEESARAGAAEALGWFGDPSAGPALIQALGRKDESGLALTKIVRALETLRIPQAADALIETLDRLSQEGALPHETTYTGPEVQRTILGALGKTGDSRAMASMVSRLSSPDEKDRQAAAEALEALDFRPPNDRDRARFAVAKKQWDEAARLGGEAVEALQVAAHDPSTAVDAVWALGATRAPEALTPLVQALQDGNLSSAAATSLRAILGACASKLAREELERLAAIGNAVQIKTVYGNCNYAEQVSSDVDCSGIRQRARQELLRREGKA